MPRTRLLTALALAGLFALAPGCTATPAATAPTTGTAAGTPVTATAAVRLNIQLRGGGAAYIDGPIKVKRGQVLHVAVTSDRQDQVHLHGLDTTIEVRPGETVERDITVDASPGLYEVETHNPVATLTILSVS